MREHLLLFLVDERPIWSGQAPELPAVGKAAAVKAVEEVAILADHVAVLPSSQEFVGRHICRYAEELPQHKEGVANQQRNLQQQRKSKEAN